MAAYRLGRVQQELLRRSIDGIVLYDPINVRYATGSRNMLVWCLHNPVRYCFVPAQGSPVLFEFRNCEHLARDLPLTVELRPAVAWSYFIAGEDAPKRARTWAEEIIALLLHAGGCDASTLAIDRLDPAGLHALAALNVSVVDGQGLMETARAIKSDDEIRCIRHAVIVSEIGMSRVTAALRPGITENELWAIFHATNIEHGGDYIETRLLNSGPRTNPWFQECSDRVIEAGDLVCHDTDMVGPYGYCIDVSRTYFCGPGRPTDAQRDTFRMAVEQVRWNIDTVRVGKTFSEYARDAWPIPPAYQDNRYATTVHGIGMTYEWPRVLHHMDMTGEDTSVFQPGMVLCAESYMGQRGAPFGIKHTEQFLITENGCEVLSRFPLDAMLA